MILAQIRSEFLRLRLYTFEWSPFTALWALPTDHFHFWRQDGAVRILCRISSYHAHSDESFRNILKRWNRNSNSEIPEYDVYSILDNDNFSLFTSHVAEFLVLKTINTKSYISQLTPFQKFQLCYLIIDFMVHNFYHQWMITQFSLLWRFW